MIDIWLIFAQMVPFIEVVLHTFIEAWREEGGKECTEEFCNKVIVTDMTVKNKPMLGWVSH